MHLPSNSDKLLGQRNEALPIEYQVSVAAKQNVVGIKSPYTHVWTISPGQRHSLVCLVKLILAPASPRNWLVHSTVSILSLAL
jgi:hypothetical protein